MSDGTKLNRKELVEQIRRQAGLSRGSGTLGYLDRKQLLELLIRLQSDNSIDRENARKEITTDAEQEASTTS